MSTTTADIAPSNIQTKLGWIYSLYACVFAFFFSILIFSPVSGAAFAAMAAVSAFVCVRIASWLSSYFGRSGYGLVACVIATILFPLVPPIVVMSGGINELLSGSPTSIKLSDYARLSAVYYFVGIVYAAPATFSATAIFQLALAAARNRHWLSFEQKWI
jgi:hypothetical protein